MKPEVVEDESEGINPFGQQSALAFYSAMVDAAVINTTWFICCFGLTLYKCPPLMTTTLHALFRI